MEEKTNKCEKSYCDNTNPMDYIKNPKSLSKIRNKSLRKFCKYYEIVKVIAKIKDIENLLKNKKEGEITDIAKSTSYAKRVFEHFSKEQKLKENPGMKEWIKNNPNKNIRWVSDRNVYDFLAALKYIESCNEIYDDMLNNKKATLLEISLGVDKNVI